MIDGALRTMIDESLPDLEMFTGTVESRLI
jgi:hypothetical protein